MSQQSSPVKQEPEVKIEITQNNESPKDIKTIKKQKKKKGKALKQFLSKPDNAEQLVQVTRNAQEQITIEARSINYINCKICGDLSQRKKICQFCKDYACTQHIRKKRKDKKTNKFVRICDDCENRLLYDKYLKFQTRAEEALVMQQMIIQAKRDQLAEIADNKLTKKKILGIKRQQIEDLKKQHQNRIKVSENQLNNKQKRFQTKVEEHKIMEDSLNKYQSELPRPLEDDYSRLQEQNIKITKQLVKYEKLCAEALKAKSIREKELYQAYYEWQKKQNIKVAKKKKDEECNIY